MDCDIPGYSTTTYNETCSCGRIFTHPAALKNHQNICLINRKKLSTALDGARKVLGERKLKRKERMANNLNQVVGFSFIISCVYTHVIIT